MAGNKEGAEKAKRTLLEKNPNHFKEIGALSWKNPERSHETGFALLPKEKHLEISKKGGQKTKEDYKKETTIPTEVKEERTGVSE